MSFLSLGTTLPNYAVPSQVTDVRYWSLTSLNITQVISDKTSPQRGQITVASTVIPAEASPICILNASLMRECTLAHV